MTRFDTQTGTVVNTLPQEPLPIAWVEQPGIFEHIPYIYEAGYLGFENRSPHRLMVHGYPADGPTYWSITRYWEMLPPEDGMFRSSQVKGSFELAKQEAERILNEHWPEVLAHNAELRLGRRRDRDGP